MESDDDEMDTYLDYFDIHEKKSLHDCNFEPTEIKKSDAPWLYALNNKYMSYDSLKVGKWMLFLPKNEVNAVWQQIKMAIKKGELWQSKVSTCEPADTFYAIMIYTIDYRDISDVIDVLNYLENSGIKPVNATIKYKANLQTLFGIYRGGKQKPWIYSSNTIRGINRQDSDSLSWRDRPSSNQSSLEQKTSVRGINHQDSDSLSRRDRPSSNQSSLEQKTCASNYKGGKQNQLGYFSNSSNRNTTGSTNQGSNSTWWRNGPPPNKSSSTTSELSSSKTSK